jgi:excisionase family DNA binding protein
MPDLLSMKKQPDPMPSFVTLQLAAKMLNLPGYKILRMIHRKELPAVLVGSKWRIPKSALTKLISPSV